MTKGTRNFSKKFSEYKPFQKSTGLPKKFVHGQTVRHSDSSSIEVENYITYSIHRICVLTIVQ